MVACSAVEVSSRWRSRIVRCGGSNGGVLAPIFGEEFRVMEVSIDGFFGGEILVW